MSIARTSLLLAASLSFTPACGSTYVSRLGIADGDAKSELAEIVREARDVQLDSQRQFQQAFRQFDRLTHPEPEAELASLYEGFQAELEDCARIGQALSDEIASIESQAARLFAEWEAGLALYVNEALRDKSAAMMVETRERVTLLVEDLNATLAAMQPVLSTYGDYALFFHHNLNVPAIGTLGDTLPEFVELNVALMGEIESDMTTAEDFELYLDGRAGRDAVVVQP